MVVAVAFQDDERSLLMTADATEASELGPLARGEVLEYTVGHDRTVPLGIRGTGLLSARCPFRECPCVPVPARRIAHD